MGRLCCRTDVGMEDSVSYSGWRAGSGCLPWCRPTPFHSSPLGSFAWKPHAPCHGGPQNHPAHPFWARLLFQMHANDSLTKPEVARCRGSRAAAAQLGAAHQPPFCLCRAAAGACEFGRNCITRIYSGTSNCKITVRYDCRPLNALARQSIHMSRAYRCGPRHRGATRPLLLPALSSRPPCARLHHAAVYPHRHTASSGLQMD